MKLNTDGVWTITSTHSRVLTAVEVLSKNHCEVPIELIKSVSNIKCNLSSVLFDLCKLKFLRYNDGYKLQFSGYDCLAIYALRKRNLQVMGDKIGVGKESDIYYGRYNDENVVLKFHRLGRTSFRSVKNLRDYHGSRKYASWLYLSKISCQREAEFLEMFKELPVPRILDSNRHVVVMELLENYVSLHQAQEIHNDKVYNLMAQFLLDLHDLGYVHGDFNEFNVMVNKDSDIRVIDFPQCVKVTHPKAKEYLTHDYGCINAFFQKRHRYTNTNESLERIIENM